MHELDPTVPGLWRYDASKPNWLNTPLIADLQVAMLAAFSALTLLLAAVGVYGVMQYLVARRRREIAVRVALGAGSRAVIGLMLARGLKQALAGIAIGVAAAAMLMRGVAGLVYGVAPLDLVSLLAASLTLTVVAAAACWSPARSAARTHAAMLMKE